MSFCFVDEPQNVMRGERVRVQVERETELLDSLIVMPRVEKHLTYIMIHEERKWIQVASSPHFGERIIKLSSNGKIVCKAIVRVGVAGIQFDGASELAFSTTVFVVIGKELPS